ncbi:MAG: hypothetical protein ACJ71K_17485 [Nitrososphaeraceae archaeon]|jgi:hypothetical protein
MSIDERLLEFLRDGTDWERKPTSIPGVFLLKLPPFKGRPATLAIEVNPVDSTGSPSKKRGIVLRSEAEIGEINRLVSNPKLSQLAKSIDEVNPQRKRPATDQRDIFEI